MIYKKRHDIKKVPFDHNWNIRKDPTDEGGQGRYSIYIPGRERGL